MYETEVNSTIERATQLLPEVREAFSAHPTPLVARTVLPWSEHCTECVWPTCYSTCEFYSPRSDGRCRRFRDGMVRLPLPEAANQYVLKIRFKRWAKLWAPANVRLYSPEAAASIENRDFQVGQALLTFPLPNPVRTYLTTKRYGFKKRLAARTVTPRTEPTAFWLECFNPSEPVALSVTMRPSPPAESLPFQQLITLRKGFQRVRIPFGEISSVLDTQRPFTIELIPNDISEDNPLYFGLLDFVQEAALPSSPVKTKCVVWDLDNTVWHGTLTEDGQRRLRLKYAVREVMQILDSRGILQSVASKNNPDEGMAALKHFGLDDLILCPQISWRPKSDAVAAIAAQLNIGVESILFVDDSPFEREQVKSGCAGVRVIDARYYLSLPEHDSCQVVVTEESRNRRTLYRAEETRQEVARTFQDHYIDFLRDCHIELEITQLDTSNLERIHELTQRTNQMNFSGNRYSREVLEEILQRRDFDTFVLSCKDRFGTYGTVGFALVDPKEPRLTDLMFSCRIQAKRVEHAFLVYLISHYHRLTKRDFQADYRKTPRNEQSGRVFEDIGMRSTGVIDGVTKLVCPFGAELSDEKIIRISSPKQIGTGV
jgi:FkbH-like protein